MRKKLTIAAVILLILGALVAFAVLNLGRLVKSNKDYILAQAEQALGRKVAVEDIGVTVWGGIGIRLKNFALADDRAFSKKDALRAADLQVNVEFFPLLWKEVRVTRLILREPVIRVIRNKQGELNFATLGGARQEKAKKAPPGATAPSAAALPLLVSDIKVADGEIHYVDNKDGTDLRVKAIDLTVKDLGFDRLVSISLDAAVNADRQNVKFNGKIGPFPPTVASDGFKNVPLSGDVTVGPVALADLQRFAPGTLPKDLKMDGPLSLSTQVDGSLEKLALKGKLEATASDIRYGSQFHKSKGVPLVVSTNAQVTPKEIVLQKVDMKLHTMELTGKGAIARGKTLAVRLTLDSRRADLGGWEKILPMLQPYNLAGDMEVHTRIQGDMSKGQLPDVNGSLKFTGLRAALPQVAQPVTAQSATVTFTGQRATLAETPLRVGKSDVRLTAQIERFAPLALTYNLSSPELWLADIRKANGATKKPEVLRDVADKGRISTKDGSLVYQGRFLSARGTIADIDYTQLEALLSMANQLLTIESLKLRAYNGTLTGTGQYDFRKTPPRFTLTSQFRDMDVSQLFHAPSATATKHIRGGANLDLNLAGSGNEWQDIQRTLTGQGKAEVVKGALLDVNIAEGALTGLTGVPGLSVFISPNTRQKYPAIFGTKNTEFGQLKGSVNIRDGKVHLDDLLITAADWAAVGKGWVTLDQKVDLSAQLVLSAQLSTDLIREVKLLKYLRDRQGRLLIPFRLAGTLPRATPQPDMDHVARLMQRGLLEQGIQEGLKQLFRK